MRILVCICGILRTLHSTYKTLLYEIVSPLLGEGVDVDISFHISSNPSQPGLSRGVQNGVPGDVREWMLMTRERERTRAAIFDFWQEARKINDQPRQGGRGQRGRIRFVQEGTGPTEIQDPEMGAAVLGKFMRERLGPGLELLTERFTEEPAKEVHDEEDEERTFFEKKDGPDQEQLKDLLYSFFTCEHRSWGRSALCTVHSGLALFRLFSVRPGPARATFCACSKCGSRHGKVWHNPSIKLVTGVAQVQGRIPISADHSELTAAF